MKTCAQVFFDVFDIFKTHSNSDQAIGDTGRRSRLWTDSHMSGCRWMRDGRARIAQIGRDG